MNNIPSGCVVQKRYGDQNTPKSQQISENTSNSLSVDCSMISGLISPMLEFHGVPNSSESFSRDVLQSSGISTRFFRCLATRKSVEILYLCFVFPRSGGVNWKFGSRSENRDFWRVVAIIFSVFSIETILRWLSVNTTTF